MKIPKFKVQTFFFKAFLLTVLSSVLFSCKKEQIDKRIAVVGSTNAIPPYSFNWETVDWMPTPAGQSQISPPWVGQGAICYGTDVLNDHKASDGWVLVYNTFDPNANGPLKNPYFMLYNRYRGLLRIYLYLTTEFVETSSYLQDGISVVSNTNSSMLKFLGTDIVDLSINSNAYSQMQPAPEGALPLASNRWYMLQYEFAYDPQIATLSYQNIQLRWFVNYYGIANISLGGSIKGSLKGTIGSAPSQSGIFSALANGGKVAGTGVLSAIGSNFLSSHALSGDNGLGGYHPTGDNDLGLSNDIFTSISKGINGALSTATGNLPGAVVNIFSAIFGGNSGSSTQSVSLNLNASINLTGTSTSGGSFPSSPTTVWMPGSNISSLAQNYVPLYNNTMGVFNLTQIPNVYFKKTLVGRVKMPPEISKKPYYNRETVYTIKNDEIVYSMIFNPAVINNSSSGATISNIVSEVLLFNPEVVYDPEYYGFGGRKESYNYSDVYTGQEVVTDYIVQQIAPMNTDVAVRISFNVVPNDGSPISTIVKTFLANLVAQ